MKKKSWTIIVFFWKQDVGYATFLFSQETLPTTAKLMVLSVDRLHWQFGPRHITSFSFLMFRGRCVKRPRSLKRMMTQKLPFEIAEMMLCMYRRWSSGSRWGVQETWMAPCWFYRHLCTLASPFKDARKICFYALVKGRLLRKTHKM